MNKVAICQEMFGDLPFEEILKQVQDLGYNGLELAPFKIAEDIRCIPIEEAKRMKEFAKKIGISLYACHWLLVSPEGMHICSPDADQVRETRNFFKGLIDFSSILGVEVLVFGSPQQRSIQKGWDFQESYERAVNFFRTMGEYARKKNIFIAFEPLGPQITNLGGDFQEAITLLEAISHPSVKLHLDTSAMVRDPLDPLEQINKVDVDQIAHVHLNDPNKLGPGMGNFDFYPLLDALLNKGYDKWFSIETFDEQKSGQFIGAQSLEYLRKYYAARGEI